MSVHRSYPYGAMPSTRWRLVVDAGRVGDAQQPEALETLLRRYMPALRAHLVIQKRVSPDHAEDLLQSFVVSKVLENALIGRADPSRGRFRTFLLTALDRFVISQARADQAIKRSPEPAALTELAERLERAQDAHEPARAYELEWARQVLNEALNQMLTSCQASNRLDVWHVFERKLLMPLLDGVAAPSYAELVETLGFQTPAQAANALITAKRMFARTLRAVVGEYVKDPDQIEAEIRELRHILARSRS